MPDVSEGHTVPPDCQTLQSYQLEATVFAIRSGYIPSDDATVFKSGYDKDQELNENQSDQETIPRFERLCEDPEG